MTGMRKRNFVAGIILLILSLVYGILTSLLPSRGIENTTEPSFFPWIITFCLFVLSGALLIQSLWVENSEKMPDIPAIPMSGIVKFIGTFIIYLAVLPHLGFIVANTLFFAVLMIFYGEHRPHWVVLGSVILSVLIFFLFRDVFQIILPAGILERWV
ncbi:MAG: tripartite tricarboxylate transporter TctB family protein [Methyloligellaceae bacterium]